MPNEGIKEYSQIDGTIKLIKVKGNISDFFENGFIIIISDKSQQKRFFRNEDIKIQLMDFFPETENVPNVTKGAKVEVTIRILEGKS